MSQNIEVPSMIFNKNGEVRTPLLVIPINGRFILAIYQGKLSKFDPLIKYRQKNKNKWSNIRTPKHIHWAVDMLIKMHEDANSTKKFLDFLIGVWDKVKPLKNEQERTELLQLDKLIQEGRKEAKKSCSRPGPRHTAPRRPAPGNASNK